MLIANNYNLLFDTQVWTPSAGSTTTQIQNQPLPQPSNGAIAGGRNPTSNPSGKNRDSRCIGKGDTDI